MRLILSIQGTTFAEAKTNQEFCIFVNMKINTTSMVVLVAMLFATLNVAAQNPIQHKKEIQAHRQEIKVKFSDAKTSPLKKEDIASFHGLDYYEVDIKFRVEAIYEEVKRPKKFKMKTSTERKPTYSTYAKLYFKIDGVEYVLNAYQNIGLMGKEGYEDYLFVPFTDETNGSETYGGGRYLEIRIPKEGNTVVLDFNKAFNPYCAYNYKYSCPIPPKENDIPIPVRAGEKVFSTDDH